MSMGELSTTVYDRIQNPVQAVELLGKAIAESGIFGCSNPAQGFVLAWECLTTRESALTLSKKNHFIENKLSMKADAMLAEYNLRGGRHKIVERSPDRCAIDFVDKDGNKYSMELTWIQAQDEPFPYKGKESEIVSKIAAWKAGGSQPELKSKYRTPRARMQMLFARLTSDSIRAIDPGVNFGQYSPEEIEDMEDESSKSTSNRKPQKTAKQAMQEAAEKAGNPNGDEIIDGSFEVVPDKPIDQPTATTSAATNSGPEPEWATARQIDEIRELFARLGIDRDAQEEILQKKNCKSLRNLTFAQAEEMLAKLRDAAQRSQPQTESPATQENPIQKPQAEQPSPAEFSINVQGPCTAEQVDTIKRLGAEIEQLQPGISAKIVAKIKSAGLSKLADLTFAEARVLEYALRAKNVEVFLIAKIEGFKLGN